jgi:hypothetical protein
MKESTWQIYLMTYGWAILIVTIIGVSLYALRYSNPENYEIQPRYVEEWECVEWDDTGYLRINLSVIDEGCNKTWCKIPTENVSNCLKQIRVRRMR